MVAANPNFKLQYSVQFYGTAARNVWQTQETIQIWI